MPDPPATDLISDVVDKYDADLVDLRRDLHAHPELSWSEIRTSDLVAARVEAAGLDGDPGCTAPGSIADLGADGPSSRCGPTWTRCRSRT